MDSYILCYHIRCVVLSSLFHYLDEICTGGLLGYLFWSPFLKRSHWRSKVWHRSCRPIGEGRVCKLAMFVSAHFFLNSSGISYCLLACFSNSGGGEHCSTVTSSWARIWTLVCEGVITRSGLDTWPANVMKVSMYLGIQKSCFICPMYSVIQ